MMRTRKPRKARAGARGHTSTTGQSWDLAPEPTCLIPLHFSANQISIFCTKFLFDTMLCLKINLKPLIQSTCLFYTWGNCERALHQLDNLIQWSAQSQKSRVQALHTARYYRASPSHSHPREKAPASALHSEGSRFSKRNVQHAVGHQKILMPFSFPHFQDITPWCF